MCAISRWVARIHLDGFAPLQPTVAVEELAGPADAVNTAAQPNRWAPRRFEWRHEMAGASVRYTFPPRSFSVLTFQRVSPKNPPAPHRDTLPGAMPQSVRREDRPDSLFRIDTPSLGRAKAGCDRPPSAAPPS